MQIMVKLERYYPLENGRVRRTIHTLPCQTLVEANTIVNALSDCYLIGTDDFAIQLSPRVAVRCFNGREHFDIALDQIEEVMSDLTELLQDLKYHEAKAKA